MDLASLEEIESVSAPQAVVLGSIRLGAGATSIDVLMDLFSEETRQRIICLIDDGRERLEQTNKRLD